MKDRNFIHQDDLFKENLGDFEAPFDPKGWEKMKALLDQDEREAPVVVVPPRKKTLPNFKTLLIIMSTLSLVSVLSWFIFKTDPSAQISKKTAVPNGEIQSSAQTFADASSAADGKSNTNSNANSNAQNNSTGYYSSKTNSRISSNANDYGRYNPNSTASSNDNMNESSTGNAVIQGSSEITGSGNSAENTSTSSNDNTNESTTGNASASQAGTANTSLGLGRMSALGFAPWVFKGNIDQRFLSPVSGIQRNKFRRTQVSYRTFGSGWVGLHLTFEDWAKEMNDDSFYKSTVGFNMQFMSKNLWSSRHIGSYLGADFGFQFYDRGPRTNVVLNNTNQDSAYTQLNKWSFDMVMRGHLEWGTFRLKPYVNVFAGPRLYFTNQKVKSYIPLRDQESSSNNNVHTGLSLIYGVGAGARYRLTRVTSIDVRMEWIQGTEVKSIDMERSSFNGINATYDLKKVTFRPDNIQWKFGVLFEVDPESETEDDFVPYNPYNPNNPNDTTRPCPCNCDSTQKTNKKLKWYQQDWDSSPSMPSRGTGKSPMPSIKPSAPARPRIKS